MQQSRRYRWQGVVWQAIACIGLFPVTVWACAVCWGADDALAHGLNVSVLFLMSMPFLIGGSIIGVVLVARQRAQGRRWPYVTIKNGAWIRKEAKSE